MIFQSEIIIVFEVNEQHYRDNGQISGRKEEPKRSPAHWCSVLPVASANQLAANVKIKFELNRSLGVVHSLQSLDEIFIRPLGIFGIDSGRRSRVRAETPASTALEMNDSVLPAPADAWESPE